MTSFLLCFIFDWFTFYDWTGMFLLVDVWIAKELLNSPVCASPCWDRRTSRNTVKRKWSISITVGWAAFARTTSRFRQLTSDNVFLAHESHDTTYLSSSTLTNKDNVCMHFKRVSWYVQISNASDYFSFQTITIVFFIFFNTIFVT